MEILVSSSLVNRERKCGFASNSFEPKTLTNSDFLSVVYGELGANEHGWVCSFKFDPNQAPSYCWAGRAYSGSPQQAALLNRIEEDNAYFCAAVLTPTSDGKLARIKSAFKRLAVLLLDDVCLEDLNGTSTYVLETSPGKYQSGISIDAQDEDACDSRLVDAIMKELAEKGRNNDTSGNSRVRYGRLPVGENTKQRPSGPFQVHLFHWNPEQILSLSDACAVFGIDIDKLRNHELTPITPRPYRPDPIARSIEGVLEGSRDETIYKYACSLRARNLGLLEAEILVLRMADCCIPPFPHAEAIKCLQSAWKHPAGKSLDFAKEQQMATTQRPLFVSASDLVLNAQPPDWLINGYLEANTLAVIFGDPEVGKSFISMGMAASIATGTDWLGNAVKRTGPVFYVCGEGYNGIARRVIAWSIGTNTPLPKHNLFFTERPISISDPQSIVVLINEIDQLAKTNGNPVAVFIDTLARNFGDGDENSTHDMTRFVNGLDAIKSKYHCTVITVHHSGHTDKSRARGSIVLKGALDAEYKVSKLTGDGIRQIAATKMKDGPKPLPLNFRITSIPLPTVLDGDGFASNGGFAELANDFSKLTKLKGKNQALLLEVLSNLYQTERANLEALGKDPEEAKVKIDTWRAAANLDRKRWCESLAVLEKRGLVEHVSDACVIPVTYKRPNHVSE